MPSLLVIESLETDLNYVKRQLTTVDHNRWSTVRAMWQNRLAEIESELAERRARKSAFASVALIFDGAPVIGTSDIRLDFATVALENYQNVIAVALAGNLAAAEVSERGKPAGTEHSRLYIRDLVRGSVGFLLEEAVPDQSNFIPTPLKEAVEGSTSLVENLLKADDEAFLELTSNIQPRLLLAIQKFADVVYKGRARTRIVGDEQKLDMSLDDSERLAKRLSELGIEEERREVAGVLLGILPESRTFELRVIDEGDQILKGSASEAIVNKYTLDASFKEQILLKPSVATLLVVRTVRSGRIKSERVYLEAISPEVLPSS